MTARAYCSLGAVLLCLSACWSTADTAVAVSGQCPAKLMVVPSLKGCTSDRDCSGGHKCCRFDCGPVCVPPVFTKPGECPSKNSGAVKCGDLCAYDSDCPNNEKCCSSGCGHQCMAPCTGMPPAEPPKPPVKPAEPPKPPVKPAEPQKPVEPPKPPVKPAEPPKPPVKPAEPQKPAELPKPPVKPAEPQSLLNRPSLQ
ncbi:WAP four-disulfide core domain protein 2-like isoform X2 [Megalobrama amblycephala]|uniref:WAP four-disulfide core domain protein 2-like isoform X2 n=1 Tax=Megalobrama amblycephala TaxID=75352 RepID=UPI0020145E8E|nr:WAP four-disulfide core domain protein 2-like isoform X2 [Megalobrama amblycephala]